MSIHASALNVIDGDRKIDATIGQINMLKLSPGSTLYLVDRLGWRVLSKGAGTYKQQQREESARSKSSGMHVHCTSKSELLTPELNVTAVIWISAKWLPFKETDISCGMEKPFCT